MGIVTGVNGDVMGLLGSCGDLVVIFYAVFPVNFIWIKPVKNGFLWI